MLVNNGFYSSRVDLIDIQGYPLRMKRDNGKSCSFQRALGKPSDSMVDDLICSYLAVETTKIEGDIPEYHCMEHSSNSVWRLRSSLS